MANEKYKPFYRVPGLEVCKNGDIYREYDDKYYFFGKKLEKLKARADKEGNLYIRIREGKFYVDELVASCFCHFPKKGYARNTCKVIHIDGNKKKCKHTNLQWMTPPEYRRHFLTEATQTDSKTGEKWIWSMYDMYVSEKGRVRIDGKDAPIHNLVSDSDLGCCRCVVPYVTSEESGQRFRVEDLVADVFCPKPNDIDFPVLLHVDNDMMNNEAKNLKWVNRTDADYIAFMEQWKKDKSAINLQYSSLA